MTDSEQVQILLSNFERSNATGSLKAANVTLAKILGLLQKQIDSLAGTPAEHKAITALYDELQAANVALTERADALAARMAETPSHYEAAGAIVGDPALIEQSDAPRDGESPDTAESKPNRRPRR